jgi:glycine/D-amino acid oxidase-like deaminating enzyme
VQPARLVRALRRAALAAGVELHERSRATAIRPGAVQTALGRLRAPEIVVAANAWLTGWRPVRGRLTTFGSYVVLTEPVPELLAELGWQGGEGIADARMFLHYFRTTEDGRVLMGSGSGPVGHGGAVGERFFADQATAGRAERGLRRLLPALAAARVERWWGGPIDVSSDQLPFFFTLPGTRIHVGVGYSGNGVGPSWLGGRILASLVLGTADEWSRLPLAGRLPPRLPPEPLRFLGAAAIRRAILAVEEADEEGRPPPRAARAVASLPRLLGLRVGVR